jgi:predicted O-linked N-acetylglucosamine transferase (SPINDLY family)
VPWDATKTPSRRGGARWRAVPTGRRPWSTARASSEEAALYERALDTTQDSLAAINLVLNLIEQGELARARSLAASVADGGDGLRVIQDIALSPVCQSVEHIDRLRTDFAQRVAALAEAGLSLTDPAAEVGLTPFYLSYHGRNNLPLFRSLAAFYGRASPGLLWTSPHCTRPRRKGGRIRVGIVSRFLHAHSIGKTTRGLVAQLSRERFEVTVLFAGRMADDEVARFIRDRADRALVLEPSLETARRQVSELELDVLFYQDIGMEAFTYFLAYSRLAPVQCVSFGHPDTTGIANMDWFVSNDLFELPGAQAHYSERLFELHDLGTLAYYYRPRLAGAVRTRASFGLSEEEHIYLCPQTLFKVHPEFDALVGGILKGDPQGRVVFIEAKVGAWTQALRERLERSLGEMAQRVSFAGHQDTESFLWLISVADVMLDTVHFNGMNTSLEAFAVGTPVVTLPGQFQRARHTQGMYRKMGLEECIARDARHYVQIALRLGMEPAWRAQVRGRILERCAVLYEDARVVREFERFFEFALEQAGWIEGRPSAVAPG